jgi:hypothetical protein
LKINIPDQKEADSERKSRRMNLIGGLIFGLIFFTLVGIRVFVYGFETVKPATWIALLIGVILFGLLAMKFRGDFWRLFIDNLRS